MARKKLTDKQVERVLIDLAEGKLTQEQIATKYETNRSSISDIATGRSYKHLKRLVPTVKRRGGQFLNLDEQVAALEREVWHLREERNHARRLAKQSLKGDGMVQHVVEALEDVVTPLKPPKRVKTSKRGKVEEEAVLVISDQHMDQIVSAESVGGHENFNFKIAVARAEHLASEVIKYLTETMSQYHFKKLHVLSLGDAISSPIHNHTVRSAFRNDFVNSFAAGQVLAAMLHDFAPYFPEINVLGLVGNHPRRSTRKAYPEPLDNFDYLVVREAEMYCRNMKNIKFNTPDSYDWVQEVNGKRIHCQHGDDLKGAHPILALKACHEKYVQIDPDIDAYVCGHFHQAGLFYLPAMRGRAPVAISNGAWVGCDPYSYQGLKVSGEPSQMLFGVHERNGITWSLPFRLRHEGEELGPKRYEIELAEHAFDIHPTTGAVRV